MSDRIGRNEPCPCGSGLKYKKCCALGSSLRSPGPRPSAPFSLLERNQVLIATIEDIFHPPNAADWNDVKRRITPDRVRRLYQVISSLWPPDLDFADLLPKPSSDLRALYVGLPRPQLVAESVFRFGLYADEILIVDPFPNPWIIREKYNPIVHPELYLEMTLQLVSFIVLLAPWIDAQIVRIIPSPNDPRLLSTLWRAAAERLQGWSSSEEDLQDEALLIEDFKERFFFKMPRFYQKRVLEESGGDLETVTAEDIEGILDHWEAERKKHPFMLDQTLDQMGGQLDIFNLGGNLEMTTMIAQLTGAFPYTNIRMKWRELLSVQGALPDAAKVWTPLTKSFQQLKFKFLNHVDSAFAVKMRQEGRLEGLRTLLRRIWGAAVEGPDSGTVDARVKGFCDELTHEYHKAKTDWDAIDRDLVKWASYGGISAVALYAAGSISPVFPALTALLGLTTGLIDSRFKRRAFRKTVPMSVFVDLERTAPTD